MKFSFGKNWLSYAEVALDDKKIAAAREAFHSLTRGIQMQGARFLDVGFGQGLTLFLAMEGGAHVYGIDVDPICRDALKLTHRFFPLMALPQVTIVSILDDSFVKAQQKQGGFDLVHSWGALHHTGDMARAFRNIASLVRPGGFLVISVYNRHWTSPLWRGVKYSFNQLPHFLQEGMVLALFPIFYFRARFLSEDNEQITVRGMDLRHDIRDWLGGHPYEYASPADVERALSALGLDKVRCDLTRGFTGCNQFVFQRTGH
jgi:2-polyprenyl-6-hydroxyphenyl methylase/3-demethylubiquinone-9 3-methyltransferase